MSPDRRNTPLLDSFATLNSRSSTKLAYDFFVQIVSWFFATRTPFSKTQSPGLVTALEKSSANTFSQPVVLGWALGAALSDEAAQAKSVRPTRRRVLDLDGEC